MLPSSIRPAGVVCVSSNDRPPATSLAAEMLMSDPMKASVSRLGTINSGPETEIPPRLGELNCNPTGTLTVSKGTVSPSGVAINSLPSAKAIELALVATKEPPTSNCALAPKRIPWGLRRNKLAVPLLSINPSIWESCPPVTRVIILSMVGNASNRAVSPVRTLNCSKL